jgi:uncharacterized lipoprotein YddW (UPF0748 family)
MKRANGCRWLRQVIAVAITLSVAIEGIAPLSAADAIAAGPEVRALWVVRTALSSPAAIDTMVNAARAAGFNTLLIQVRGRADAYYAGGLEPRPVSLALQPSFDPLGTAIAKAHEAGLRVHAWVNVNLVAGANDLPSARDHVIYRHPEWLMVPRALADSLRSVDPKSPEYLGRLIRYVRSQAATLEGLYLSPVPDGAAGYTVGVVADIVQRYAVDGVHLDYARYPNDGFDYGRESLAAFRRDVVAVLGPTDRQKYDGRLAREPFIYTDAFPERWRRFRSERLTALVGAVSQAVKAARPSAVMSVAVMPDSLEAASTHFQDWRSWLERDLVDVVCPMAYTTNAGVFASQIAAARSISGGQRIWAGIGAYRLTPAEIAENVQSARRASVGGIILFSYDSLAEPARGSEFLSQVGRAAFVQ